MLTFAPMASLVNFCFAFMAIALVAPLAGPIAAAMAASLPDGQIVKQSTQTIPFGVESAAVNAPRVDRPYFDQSGQLHWADTIVHGAPTGSCDTKPAQQNTNGYPIYPRQTKLLAPRVDERLCSRPGNGTETALVGIDSDGQKSWQRQTVFLSGSHRIDQRLIGASADGLVLSSLEVWSAHSGATILPAVTRAIPSAKRAVPLHSYWGAALYHPLRRRFYVFDANVSLTTRQGGVYEIEPAAGVKTLIHPVVTALLGSFDRVEELALLADGRYLALAQRQSNRGSTQVSLAILDLTSHRLLFDEHFCQRSNDSCTNPHVDIGPRDTIGFSYTNLNRQQHQLVLYQWH